MVANLDHLMLDEDFEEAKALAEKNRWILERGNALEVTASMSPLSNTSEIYKARLAWQSYADREWPSLKFVDQDGQINNPRAWPQCEGFRPTNLDACVHFTREGHNTHPEWVTDARTTCPSEGNTLLMCLDFLQHRLNNNYTGRHNG